MRIGGFVRQSLIDWDGKITAVIFTRGCNFRCGYCHNPLLVIPELYRNETDISPKMVIKFLQSRTGWLDGVVISGGEPTIQPDLSDFIQQIKNLGLAVKLDTNGTHPKLLRQLIDKQLIDFVAMDIKMLLNAENYEKVTGINNKNLFLRVQESVELLKTGKIPYQFRTTLLPDIHTHDVIQQMKADFEGHPLLLQSFCNKLPIVANHQLVDVF